MLRGQRLRSGQRHRYHARRQHVILDTSLGIDSTLYLPSAEASSTFATLSPYEGGISLSASIHRRRS